MAEQSRWTTCIAMMLAVTAGLGAGLWAADAGAVPVEDVTYLYTNVWQEGANQLGGMAGRVEDSEHQEVRDDIEKGGKGRRALHIRRNGHHDDTPSEKSQPIQHAHRKDQEHVRLVEECRPCERRHDQRNDSDNYEEENEPREEVGVVL